MIVVPRPVFPDRSLRPRDAVAAGEEQLADEAAVVCHRYLIVVPRPFPAAPFLVRRRYLIVVVSRPLLAAPLTVRRTYLVVVLRPMLRPLPVATRRRRIKRRTHGR